ncbi:MAG: protoporphyrinogen oxidase [Balneolaceae bacterium]
MNKKKIAVVGAGITGLTAARALQEKGHVVVLFERKKQAGGSVKSVSRDGWLTEYGPNTLQLKHRRLAEFIEQLGLQDQITEATPSSRTRYIAVGDSLKAIPTGFLDFFRSPILSPSGKLKLLREPFVPRGRNSRESLASFVERRLGREVLDYLVDPFVSGIYAGTPRRLSAKLAFPALYNLEQQYGSLFWGMGLNGWKGRRGKKFKARLVSFENGLQTLTEQLAAEINDIRLEADVTRIHKKEDGWEITANGVTYSSFHRVLTNIPLYRFSEQLIDGGGDLLDVMADAEYPPLSVIFTGYIRGQIGHPLDGFGFLVPEVEQRTILGSLFSSAMFPNRAPEGKALITTFVGGSRQPELASLDSERLREMVTGELKHFLGIKGEPVFFDHVYWPRAIPQYTRQYHKVTEAISDVEERNRGVYLSGNFRGGISIPACIENGLEWAEKISGSFGEGGPSTE